MKRRFSIKNRLNLTAFVVLLLLIFLGLITIYYVNKVNQHYALINLVDDITKNQLKLRKAEKDFIQNDLDNIDFYENKTSIYITEFDSIFETVNAQIAELDASKTVKSNRNQHEIENLKKDFQKYHSSFHELTEEVYKKGFKDFGIVGLMRDKIHEVESSLSQINNNQSYMVHMLMLRRHEKDYLLRKDLKYRTKFNKEIDAFVDELEESDDQKNQSMIALLYDYKTLFSDVIGKDIQIGLNPGQGIVKRLNNSNFSIDQKIDELQKTIKDESKKQIAQAINIILIVAVIMFGLIVFIIRRVSSYINASINYLQKYITRLGKGELPDKIEVTKNDEISDMIHSVNDLTENLKNTREFAIEVGNGNLETEVNVFNNEGDLGSSLAEMRNKLLEVANERQQNELENQRRNWINEGVAKFGEILRVNNNDLEKLAYELLNNLIEYLDANQGVVYIINDDHENKDEHYLELLSAIAYGRKKYMKDRVEIGEDVIGRCAYERKTIYMTDIPEDFIKITSGLGTSNPRAVLIVPLMLNEEIFGVIELASFKEFEKFEIEFVERIAKNIANTISHVKINKHTEKLLKQAQVQSEEITAQEEELRQNMEELKATQEEASRRESEVNRSLDAINSHVYIASIDTKGNIQQINKAFLQFFNMPLEQMLDKKFVSYFVVDRSSTDYLRFWNDVLNGKSRKKELMTMIEDKKYWLSTSFIPMQDDNGTINHILTVSHDITETVSLRNQLNSAKQEINVQ